MPKVVAQKEDWVKLGYQLFSENGISGIVIEKMARKLGCNKSSFYWHFKTKNDFVENIIDFWVSIDTKDIIELSNSGTSALHKFQVLIEITFKKDIYLDFIFYLKRYALKEKKIQAIIDRIDAQRIAFVASLLEGMGYSSKDSNLKSALFYKYLIGYHEMMRYKDQQDNYVDEVYQEIHQFIKF